MLVAICLPSSVIAAGDRSAIGPDRRGDVENCKEARSHNRFGPRKVDVGHLSGPVLAVAFLQRVVRNVVGLARASNRIHDCVIDVGSMVHCHTDHADERHATANSEGEDDQQPEPNPLVNGFLRTLSIGVGKWRVVPRLRWVPAAI